MLHVSMAGGQIRTVWPPDDTEESVVGTDRHQMTIMNLRWGINELARAGAAPGEPARWQALSQTMITGFARPDGSRYTALPDVFVYARPIAQDRGSVSLIVDGPPVLIVEVASESTYASDLDLAAGKGWSYAQAGVQEYMVLDPTGLYLPELARAWRLEGRAYVPWIAGADGRRHSGELPIAIGVEDGLAAVYGRDGARQLREGEVGPALAGTQAALIKSEEELRRKDAELARQAEELAEVRRRLEQFER